MLQTARSPAGDGGGIALALRLRWWIVLVFLLASINNYLDRQALSVLAPVLRTELSLSAFDYSLVLNAFLLAYATMYAVSGRLIDRFGPGIGIAWCLFVWSTAASMHGLVGGLLGLALARFALGLAEPGLYPGAIKVLSSLFSPSARGLPIGIVVSGASIGAILAPPVVLALNDAFNWRVAFFVTGASGYLLLIAWLALRKPIDSAVAVAGTRNGATPAAAGLDEAPGATAPGTETAAPLGSLALLRLRPVRAYMLARLLGDPAWYFVVFWLPDYLVQERGLSLAQLGQIGWVPYVGLDIGVIFGGMFSGWLIRRAWPGPRARLAVAIAATVVFTVGILQSSVATEPLTILLLIGAAVFAIGLWMATIYALPGDVLPLSNTASVVGFGGAAGSIGGMAFATFTGLLADRGLYAVAFLSAPVLFVLSVVILILGMGQKRALA